LTLPLTATAHLRQPDGTVLFASLPADVRRVQQLLAPLLPVDARGRAATVCRLWRDALAQPAAWTTLDVSRTSGVAAARLRTCTALSSVARAHGCLVTLDASDRYDYRFPSRRCSRS
jgi:hypothetical protein